MSDNALLNLNQVKDTPVTSSDDEEIIERVLNHYSPRKLTNVEYAAIVMHEPHNHDPSWRVALTFALACALTAIGGVYFASLFTKP